MSVTAPPEGEDSPRALVGLRVVEVAHGLSGEMAGMLLADNGAEVLKIEPPGGTRRRGDAGFRVWNRGKRSVVADLASAAGKAQLAGLLADGDALVTDLSPATQAELGLGYDELAGAHPGLCYVTITGFGERGPLASLPGYEYIVQAKSGFMAEQVTVSGERPSFTPTPVLSYGAATLAVSGLLAAIHQRGRDGRGQRVHTSLLHALVTLDMTTGHGHRSHFVDDSGRVYGVLPFAFMTARCKDGRYLQMCSRFPRLFRNWMRVLGLEYLYDDPAYQQMPDVFPSREAMDDLIALARAKMAERTAEDWLALFSVEDVGANPFLSPEEFLHSAQAEATGRVAEIEDPELGTLLQIGPLGEFSATPSRPSVGAPLLGAGPAAWLGSRDHTPENRIPENRIPENRIPENRIREESTSPRHPLDDLVVIELGFAYAGPQAMTLLGEMGARVIKVEPPAGDTARRNWTTTYSKEAPGKESVIADLKTPEGRRIVHELVQRADILLHNFRPGVPERLGVDYATLSALNSRLIYVYGSCYGSRGPWSHLAGFHSSPNAISGSGILEAGVDNPPQNRTFGDPVGALAVTASTLVALAARERTGRGQYVEGTMLASVGYAVSHYSVQGQGITPPPPLDHTQRGLSPFCRLYPTRDGTLLLCCLQPSERAAFEGALAAEGTVLDPAAGPGVEQVISAALARRGATEWEQLLLAAGVPAVRADGTAFGEFMLNSPQMRENELSIEDDVPGVGRIWRSSGCVEFSGAQLRISTPEPLGASTAAVLAELGYSDEEITDLEARGITKVVGQGL